MATAEENRQVDPESRDGLQVLSRAASALDEIATAPGMSVNLFADELRFNELVNPVQMAFDTRGRLWVAAWETYPHWEPGQPMNDRLLVLEDVQAGIGDPARRDDVRGRTPEPKQRERSQGRLQLAADAGIEPGPPHW